MALVLDRRQFMAQAGAAFAAALTPAALRAAEAGDALFATAFMAEDRSFGVAVLSEKGEIVHSLALPARGHDVTFDPVSRRSVVFARQPGTFAVVFDLGGRAPPVTIASAPGRHFFGHGVFSPDGSLLYATENDFEAGHGVVGIYDARDGFRRVGEFPTHGIGPHELLLLGDGRTLAIANGGIATHPDFPRAELNLATMEPSLVFVDRLSGDAAETHVLSPSLSRLSIRHMAVDGGGRVWFGCQYRGPQTDTPPLVGCARPGEAIRLLDMAPDVLADFRNYIGSVAANPAAGAVAVSSPQGDALVAFDPESGRVLRRERLREVCGIAPEGEGFRATTGEGVVETADGTAHRLSGHVWDNHLLLIG